MSPCVNAQLACGIHWHGAHDAAVHKVVLADGDGLEHAGHAARCAHGLARVAACKHRALAVFQPRGHDHKRLGHLLQRLAAHLFVHIVFELLAQHQPAGRKLQVADLGLVQRHGFFLHFKGVHSTGVERAHHAACAGARDHRRRKAVGFQHLDDANVRETLGCATAQGNADADRGSGGGKSRLRPRVGPGGGGAATSSQGQGCQHGHGGNAGQRVEKSGQAHARRSCGATGREV